MVTTKKTSGYTVPPMSIMAILYESYDVQRMGTTGYFDYANKAHPYTFSQPSTPNMDRFIVQFRVEKRREAGMDVYYLTPVEPEQLIDQAIVDRILNAGYKFAVPPKTKPSNKIGLIRAAVASKPYSSPYLTPKKPFGTIK
jgi:hypothetical protein